MFSCKCQRQENVLIKSTYAFCGWVFPVKIWPFWLGREAWSAVHYSSNFPSLKTVYPSINTKKRGSFNANAVVSVSQPSEWTIKAVFNTIWSFIRWLLMSVWPWSTPQTMRTRIYLCALNMCVLCLCTSFCVTQGQSSGKPCHGGAAWVCVSDDTHLYLTGSLIRYERKAKAETDFQASF